ncbi:MAG: DUF4386 domain-containing protein [Bacteroidetes bacterium]|nr:DUF4386 domain-containing protein [Bacteroidota bacterium]
MTLTPSSVFSPIRYARIGGVIYLIIIVAGIFGEAFVRNRLVVPGDAAATASNIMASPFLWRMGIAVDLIMQMCDLPVMMILYVLLKPVNKNVALLTLLFNIIQTAVLVANKLSLLMPLFVLGDGAYLTAFNPQQLQSLSYLFIKLHGYGFAVGLIFFGVVCLLEGSLIRVSGFIPKTIGLLMQVAGVCYLINSFALILFPTLADALFPFILLPCLLAELSLALWMTIKGVDEQRWLQWSAKVER